MRNAASRCERGAGVGSWFICFHVRRPVVLVSIVAVSCLLPLFSDTGVPVVPALVEGHNSFVPKSHSYSNHRTDLLRMLNRQQSYRTEKSVPTLQGDAPAAAAAAAAALSILDMVHRGGGVGQDTGSTANKFFAAAEGMHLPSKNIVYDAVLLTMQIITSTFRTVLPPIVTAIRTVVDIYRILPMDVLLAQIGFVYAFAGGYYPTLFAAIQAAQHCGYYDMISAIKILYNEATTAIQACNFPSIRLSSNMDFNRQRAREIFIEKTKIVMATIDPVRINEAIAAIYTTWFSISIVLEREFARTITLSITIAESIQPIVSFILVKPLQLCISSNYYQWIPILIGWVCKAMAMSLAWRIQRVLTAYTSAIVGGLMCSRAIFRIIHKRAGSIRRFFGLGSRTKQKVNDSTDPNFDATHTDEFLGYIIAMCGLYAQIGDGNFSFEVPFPLNLVTWPFDLAERWIQWQITKKSNEIQ